MDFENRKHKSRGNGQGAVYKRGKTWEAQIVVGWLDPKDPHGNRIPVKRRKGGFKRKDLAVQYLEKLREEEGRRRRITLQQLYKEWSDLYDSRVVSSTMGNYDAAYKHFSSLHGLYIDKISADDLQRCMDACPAGHRTHQNMKCIAGLLWGYACDNDLVDRDITKNLFIGRGASVQRDPITAAEVSGIRSSIGSVRYAEYIYCLCYLGFRPGEMLELKKDMLHCTTLPADDVHPDRTVYYFINGKKTAAGKDRIVIVPDQILEIVLSRLFIPGTDLVFPMYVYSRKEGAPFKNFKPMTHEYFNKHVFQPLMLQLGFPSGKVPYCARHTYADMLKSASGSDKDKAALIGHSSYLFTQARYQSTAIADLKALVDSFE
jgi:hypothetical protein